MNTRFLETLVWLTRLRSFSQVADKLHTSQPAISNRMNKLEELLGVRLYDRSARQFELTPAGRRILRHAEQMVALSSELYELAASEEQLDAQLRIGITEVITMSWLPMFVDRIMEAFPRAAFKIGTGTGPELLEKLRQDEMDLVFVVNPVNEPGVIASAICSIATIWVANPTRFPIYQEIDAVELSRLPLMMPSRLSSPYDFLMDYFHRFNVSNIGSTGQRLEIEAIYSLGTSIQLALSGMGIAPVPTFLVADDLAAGRLIEIKLRHQMSPQNVIACFKQPVINNVIHRLVEIAKDTARDYSNERSVEHIWT